MAGDAILRDGIGAGSGRRRRTQQPCWGSGIVRHVAGGARVDPNCWIRADVPIGRDLVRRGLMNAAGESGEQVDLPLHHAIRIMAGETHLCVRTVAHKKILRDPVDALYVRTVATGAFDVAIDQLHSLCRVSGLALGDERCHQIGRIFKRKH